MEISRDFPPFRETDLDYLDGCTPASMFNIEIEELVEALLEGMKAFRGVPSTVFYQNVPDEEIFFLCRQNFTRIPW